MEKLYVRVEEDKIICVKCGKKWHKHDLRGQCRCGLIIVKDIRDIGLYYVEKFNKRTGIWEVVDEFYL
ncbi:MAG: hypothetical protein DRP09_12990 [Candidatus Thorarchaeota archaeon]|nr:MAG: hypothetical protein DRP09_12990 [Candidatus Thorarchaeota archaeon]